MNSSLRHGAVSLLLTCVFAGACAPEERSYDPAPSSSCEDALVCDDFESVPAGAAPGKPWLVAAESGTVTVDEHPYRGKHAVKLTTDKGTGFKGALLQFSDTSKLPSPGNLLYGRMMMWIESVPPTDLTWNIITGKGLVPGQPYPAVYNYGGRLAVAGGSLLAATYDTPSSYDNPPVGPATSCWSNAQSDIAPIGKWACFEWVFDGPNNGMQFWIDGYGVPGLSVPGIGEGCTSQPADYPWTAPLFRDIFLGWQTFEPDETRTVWIDDVVIDVKRVGCP